MPGTTVRPHFSRRQGYGRRLTVRCGGLFGATRAFFSLGRPTLGGGDSVLLSGSLGSRRRCAVARSGRSAVKAREMPLRDTGGGGGSGGSTAARIESRVADVAEAAKKRRRPNGRVNGNVDVKAETTLLVAGHEPHLEGRGPRLERSPVHFAQTDHKLSALHEGENGATAEEKAPRTTKQNKTKTPHQLRRNVRVHKKKLIVFIYTQKIEGEIEREEVLSVALGA